MQRLEINWRIATSIHEVCHALLAVLVGNTLKSVRMNRVLFTGGKYEGEVCYTLPVFKDKDPDEFMYSLTFEDVKMICYFYIAGQEGESLWISGEYNISMEEARELTAAGAKPDLRNFKAMSSYVEGLTLKDARCEVDKIIGNHWHKVALLAEILAERYRLSPRVVTKHVKPGSDELAKVIKPVLYVPSDSAA